MKEINKVSIIGLGALGVMFGHHLSKKMSSEHLRIVADPERVQKYQNNEIYCNGERCQFNYITSEDEDDPADLVIFAVKYLWLEDAM